MLLAALLYWAFVITEGAYLGSRVVAWTYDLAAKKYDSIKQFRPLDDVWLLASPMMNKLREVNGLRELISREGAKMPSAERRAKMEEYQKALRDYQRLVADSRDDIVREDRELVAIIIEKADSIVKEGAKRNKYSIVLKDPNAVGYLDPEVDITNEVLKELNKKK